MKSSSHTLSIVKSEFANLLHYLKPSGAKTKKAKQLHFAQAQCVYARLVARICWDSLPKSPPSVRSEAMLIDQRAASLIEYMLELIDTGKCRLDEDYILKEAKKLKNESDALFDKLDESDTVPSQSSGPSQKNPLSGLSQKDIDEWYGTRASVIQPGRHMVPSETEDY